MIYPYYDERIRDLNEDQEWDEPKIDETVVEVVRQHIDEFPDGLNFNWLLETVSQMAPASRQDIKQSIWRLINRHELRLNTQRLITM